MEKVKKMIPYLAVTIFTFYVLPFFIKDTGSGMLILLIGIPMICYVVSLVYGIKNSLNWLFPLLTMLLFAPTIFIFYNDSASIYILVYGLISLVGNFIGSLIHKKNNRKATWKLKGSYHRQTKCFAFVALRTLCLTVKRRKIEMSASQPLPFSLRASN